VMSSCDAPFGRIERIIFRVVIKQVDPSELSDARRRRAGWEFQDKSPPYPARSRPSQPTGSNPDFRWADRRRRPWTTTRRWAPTIRTRKEDQGSDAWQGAFWVARACGCVRNKIFLSPT
jgi:hypothetical protein